MLETAALPGGHQDDRHNAIRDVIADDLPRSRTEPSGYFDHVLPQNLDRRVRRGITPDISARTQLGQPDARRDEVAVPVTVFFDVKQLTQGAPGYDRRTADRRGPLRVRAEAVPGEYRYKARCLDRDHHAQADGTPYPSPPVQEARGLVGPVFATLQALPTVRGLVVGSFQGASDDVHALAREVATRQATDEWRRMGARSFSDAYGIYLDDTRARWSGVFWSSWAALMVGRLPCVGRADAAVMRLGDVRPGEGPERPGRRGGWPRPAPEPVRYGGGRSGGATGGG